jgi:hypothetical protein
MTNKPSRWRRAVKAMAKVVDPEFDPRPIASCPKCHSDRVVGGAFTSAEAPWVAMFRPATVRFWTMSFDRGIRLEEDAYACQDCGFLWGGIDPQKLNSFLAEHCNTMADDPEAALLIATRLERKGKLADAKTAYELVIERFPQTQAAKDAAASLRTLQNR